MEKLKILGILVKNWEIRNLSIVMYVLNYYYMMTLMYFK